MMASMATRDTDLVVMPGRCSRCSVLRNPAPFTKGSDMHWIRDIWALDLRSTGSEAICSHYHVLLVRGPAAARRFI